jgi:hypothetical protein
VPFPERRIVMDPLDTTEAIQFLAGVAERELEVADEPDEAADSGPPDRPLTMAELMELNRQNQEQEALDALEYPSVEALLLDYQLVYTRRIRLRDLATFRETGLIEQYYEEMRNEGRGDAATEP